MATEVGLGHYLVVSAILLVLAIFGIFLNRKNVIIILMSIELMLLAVNLNLVAFSAALGDLVGQVFAMFVLMGAEFLAMILIVVYVGAVAVLFLFVIMMLDVDFLELREGFIEYLPVGLVIGGIFLFELLLTVGFWVINPGVTKTITAAIPANVSNTEALGLVLYTKYVHYFQLAGMVLLVAMIGAIVLTLRHKASVKRQDINVQNARTPEMAMAMRKVAPGQGLSDADAAEWVK